MHSHDWDAALMGQRIVLATISIPGGTFQPMAKARTGRAPTGYRPAKYARRTGCIHLGSVISSKNSAGRHVSCSGEWLRECELFEECRVSPKGLCPQANCQTCE